jgi:mRNA-degrading endonuclease RelE of RelBE toxin-antitoxin system
MYEPAMGRPRRLKRLRNPAHPQYCFHVDDIRVFYDIMGEVVEIIAVIYDEAFV